MSNWSKMGRAEQQAAQYAAHAIVHLEAHRKTSVTMTEATVAIYGTSGRGSPAAQRIIEAAARYGYLQVTPSGKRVRYVSAGTKPIPQEAMSDEDRQYEVELMRDQISQDLDHQVARVEREIKAAPTAGAAQEAFYGGLRDILGGGRRR